MFLHSFTATLSTASFRALIANLYIVVFVSYYAGLACIFIVTALTFLIVWVYWRHGSRYLFQMTVDTECLSSSLKVFWTATARKDAGMIITHLCCSEIQNHFCRLSPKKVNQSRNLRRHRRENFDSADLKKLNFFVYSFFASNNSSNIWRMSVKLMHLTIEFTLKWLTNQVRLHLFLRRSPESIEACKGQADEILTHSLLRVTGCGS